MKKKYTQTVKSFAYSCYLYQPVKGCALIDINYYDTKGKNVLEIEQGALLLIVHPLLEYIKQAHCLDIILLSLI